jgi:hypothetical protein
MTRSDIDGAAAALVEEQTTPRPGECLHCYVYRMLVFACDGTLRWALRWRDLRAPRVRALEHTLHARGGYCDCEIFLNGWQPRVVVVGENGPADFPHDVPPCAGGRSGSTDPCRVWAPTPQLADDEAGDWADDWAEDEADDWFSGPYDERDDDLGS